MKTLQYLPYRSKHEILVQAKIPKELHSEIKNFMKERNLNWNDVVIACMQSLLDELRSLNSIKSDSE